MTLISNAVPIFQNVFFYNSNVLSWVSSPCMHSIFHNVEQKTLELKEILFFRILFEDTKNERREKKSSIIMSASYHFVLWNKLFWNIEIEPHTKTKFDYNYHLAFIFVSIRFFVVFFYQKISSIRKSKKKRKEKKSPEHVRLQIQMLSA